MFLSSVPHNEVAQRILNATDRLMAKNGVQYLSTHKIAKEAGTSVGTIYLHFKDKEDLLNQLVLSLFNAFQAVLEAEYDPALPLFEQYQKFWHAEWQFMQANPSVVKNMYQYEALPQFQVMLRECANVESLAWYHFVRAGQKQGVIASLPADILFVMSLKTAWQLMYQQLVQQKNYADEVLEQVILRTWQAIIV